MKERLADKIFTLPAETVWWFGENLLRIKIDGNENLTLIQEHLKKGSLLIYFNHTSFLDPGLVLRLIFENLDISSRQIAVFTSQKHLDTKRGRINWFHSLVIKGSAEIKNFELLPVVQEYDRDSYKDYLNLNVASLKRAIRFLKFPGKILLIAPEETRSKSGALIEAKEGIEAIFKLGKESLLALPIGITGAKEWFNPANQTKLVVGRPFSFAGAEAEATSLVPIKDILMIHLAQLLPPEQRGFYEKFL